MCTWDALSRPREAREAVGQIMEASGPLLVKGGVDSEVVVLLGLTLQSEEHLAAVKEAAEEVCVFPWAAQGQRLLV